MLERTDSAALLDRVVRANLFVVALDEEGLWWRYHALFAEYLRLRVGERAAGCINGRRWFEQHGLHEDAVDHAAACGDVELIARTLEADRCRWRGRGGRRRSSGGWRCSRARWSARGRACCARARSPPAARAPASGDPAHAQPRGADAARHPERWTGYHEAARLLLAAVYGDDDVARTVERSERAVERAREDADTLVVPAMAMLAWAQLLAGEDDAALELARTTEIHPDADRRPFGVVGALAVQAVVAAERENPVVAERLAERAVFEATRAGVLESTAAGCAHFASRSVRSPPAGPPTPSGLAPGRTIEPAIDGGAMHVWVMATFAARSPRVGACAERAGPGASPRAARRVHRPGCGGRARGTGRGRRDRRGAAAPIVTEALSPAELSVLRHFEGGRTARVIGAELNSRSTPSRPTSARSTASSASPRARTRSPVRTRSPCSTRDRWAARDDA